MESTNTTPPSDPSLDSSSSIMKIDSLPNLRILCKRPTSSTTNPLVINTAAVYRSSKPDKIISAHLDEFRKLGIKCIIDFRSKDEYFSSEGHRLLDKEYSLFKVCLPKENYKPGQSIQAKEIPIPDDLIVKSEPSTKDVKDSISETTPEGTKNLKQHYLIDFFSMKYILSVFNRLPWHLWCVGILYYLYDFITRNKFKNFTKFFVSNAVNRFGIYGQYKDIVNFSQPAICSALKLIADPENHPVLINCAYGKDRTGIVSALILTCLGLSKEEVAEEYALSSDGLEPIKHLLYKDLVEKYNFKEEFCRAETETMIALLTYIEREYSSIENYMLHIGFGLEEQKVLKEQLEPKYTRSSMQDKSQETMSNINQSSNFLEGTVKQRSVKSTH
ncbi:uncharacterized protein LOC131951027 [Physella acuta]|uniref:uncharacterized protein LOC131951027 n=1 Tax=Physella acuta TaxID=109671 RepID=UPI0027DD58DF|nr:uncharacterized protein LOC131951027 [Physella acuta]